VNCSDELTVVVANRGRERMGMASCCGLRRRGQGTRRGEAWPVAASARAHRQLRVCEGLSGAAMAMGGEQEVAVVEIERQGGGGVLKH
jgi:hypothetical protein